MEYAEHRCIWKGTLSETGQNPEAAIEIEARAALQLRVQGM